MNNITVPRTWRTAILQAVAVIAISLHLVMLVSYIIPPNLLTIKDYAFLVTYLPACAMLLGALTIVEPYL